MPSREISLVDSPVWAHPPPPRLDPERDGLNGSRQFEQYNPDYRDFPYVPSGSSETYDQSNLVIERVEVLR